MENRFKYVGRISQPTSKIAELEFTYDDVLEELFGKGLDAGLPDDKYGPDWTFKDLKTGHYVVYYTRDGWPRIAGTGRTPEMIKAFEDFLVKCYLESDCVD